MGSEVGHVPGYPAWIFPNLLVCLHPQLLLHALEQNRVGGHGNRAGTHG